MSEDGQSSTRYGITNSSIDKVITDNERDRLSCPVCSRSKVFKNKRHLLYHLGQHNDITRKDLIKYRQYLTVYNNMKNMGFFAK